MAKKKKDGTFSKIVVILCILLVVFFTPIFLYAFIKVGSEPSILISLFFGFITVELWNLAGIKKTEVKKKRISEIKEDNYEHFRQ